MNQIEETAPEGQLKAKAPDEGGKASISGPRKDAPRAGSDAGLGGAPFNPPRMA